MACLSVDLRLDLSDSKSVTMVSAIRNFLTSTSLFFFLVMAANTTGVHHRSDGGRTRNGYLSALLGFRSAQQRRGQRASFSCVVRALDEGGKMELLLETSNLLAGRRSYPRFASWGLLPNGTRN
jgi:hypothetical protein